MDYKLGMLFMIHKVSSIYDELVVHVMISFDSTSVGGPSDWRKDLWNMRQK